MAKPAVPSGIAGPWRGARWIQRLSHVLIAVVLATLCAILFRPAAAADAPDAAQHRKFASALVVDLAGSGIRTADHSTQIYFDFDNDGRGELTTWPLAPAALLVLDRNGDERIDHGAELFGNFAPLRRGKRAAHGFAALAAFDHNRDGLITSRDPIFSRLRLWVDAQNRGRAHQQDLKTLAEAGIEALSVQARDIRTLEGSGSVQRRVGAARLAGQEHAVVEVWFSVSPNESLEWHPVAADAEVARLPHARGFGQVRDLRAAMMRDAALKRLVARHAAAKSAADADALLDPILWAWTGAATVGPGSRGGWIDARYLAVMEAFIGEEFRGAAKRGMASSATHDVVDLPFGDDRPGSRLRAVRGPDGSPERSGRIRELTGADEDRWLGSFNPSGRSAEILMLEYARLRAFVRAQLMAQTFYAAELDLKIGEYDPRHPPPLAEPARVLRALEHLHAHGEHGRLLDVYCTLEGIAAMPGYDAEALQRAILAHRGLRGALDLALHARTVSQPPQTWSSAERTTRDSVGTASVGCLDLMRVRNLVAAPTLVRIPEASRPPTGPAPLPPDVEPAPETATPSDVTGVFIAAVFLAAGLFWSRKSWK